MILQRTFLGFLAATSLLSCARNHEADLKPKREQLESEWITCTAATKPEPCLDWGRNLMGVEPANLTVGEAQKKRIDTVRSRFPDQEEILAIAGAAAVRLGGMYATSQTDIVKGVDLIQAGLDSMLAGMHRHPGSKVLHIYYSNTLSYLPADFKKGPEASDTIASLRRNFKLNAEEDALVAAAESRLGGRTP